MNSPTTLYTSLLVAIPALVAPAQACPYCQKGEPHDPEIDWNKEIVIRGWDDFVPILQPLVSGKVRAQYNDSDTPHIVFMGTEDDKASVYAPCGDFLCIYLPDNTEQEVLPRIMRGLNRLTVDGKLRTVRLSELERVISEEVEYKPVAWENVIILAPDSLQKSTQTLAEQLRPIVAGTVGMISRPSAEATTAIQLNIHKSPTQAKAIAEHNCIQLNINSQDSPSIAIERFINVLRQIATEDGGKIQSVSEKRLNAAFHESYRAHRIDWQHIVIPAELGDEVADWFGQHTSAKVEFYDNNSSINYTQHTLLVKMRYGVKGEGNWTLMTLAADIIPTLHLSIAKKQKDSALTDTQYRQAVALQLLEWLRPLMKDDKLPAITVEELQEHLRKIKRPMRQP